MSEITKLYENAGVLKECLSPCYINKTWRKTHDCPNCNNRENYPLFTAEKQLELIKWVAKNKEECRITYDKEYEWCTATDWQSSFCYDNFSESLANLINSLWQSLTEAEKQQVKGILE